MILSCPPERRKAAEPLAAFVSRAEKSPAVILTIYQVMMRQAAIPSPRTAQQHTDDACVSFKHSAGKIAHSLSSNLFRTVHTSAASGGFHRGPRFFLYRCSHAAAGRAKTMPSVRVLS
jgi:hypothetical protein